MKSSNTKKRAPIAIIMTFLLCFGCLAGCKRNTQTGSAPETPPVTYVSRVDVDGRRTIGEGDRVKLSATLTAKGDDGSTVVKSDGFEFISEDDSVAKVENDGTLTGVSEGVAEIVAKNAEFKASGSFLVQVLSAAAPDTASGKGLLLMGRAQTGGNGVIATNAASGVSVNVKGEALKATVTAEQAQTLFVTVDGKETRIEVAGGTSQTTLAELGDGIHRVSVYKTSDAGTSLTFSDFYAEKGSFYSAPPESDKKMMVLGDATVLGGNLGDNGSADATAGYAFRTALDAGYDIEMIGRADATAARIKAEWSDNAGKCVPDVILLQLGSVDLKQNFSASAFDGEYGAILGEMRTAYPDAQIICAYGGDANSFALGNRFKKIVAKMHDEKTSVLPLGRIDDKITDGGAADDATPESVWHGKAAGLLSEAVGGKTVAAAYDANKEDMHVILLGGQSNMEGNSHWRYLIGKDENFADYKNGYDGIKMSFALRDSEAGKAPDFKPVKLVGGAYNNDKWDTGTELTEEAVRYGYSGKVDDTFGPEIGMAKVLSANGYDNNVTFIKLAHGGTSFKSWKAPNGTLYKAFIKYVDACLKKLSENYNVTLDAMFWMQGESDADTAEQVSMYKTRLGNFIKCLRSHFESYNKDFYFYDSLIIWPPSWNQGMDGINKQKSALNKITAFHRIIDNPSFITNYSDDCIGKEPLQPKRDGAHYDAADEIRLGEEYAKAYMRDFPAAW